MGNFIPHISILGLKIIHVSSNGINVILEPSTKIVDLQHIDMCQYPLWNRTMKFLKSWFLSQRNLIYIWWLLLLMFDSNRISSSCGALRGMILLHCKLITSDAVTNGDGIVTYANVCCKLNPSWTGDLSNRQLGSVTVKIPMHRCRRKISHKEIYNSWMAMHGYTQSFH